MFGLGSVAVLLTLHALDLLPLRFLSVVGGIAAVMAFTNFGRSCPLFMSLSWQLKRLSGKNSGARDQKMSDPNTPTIE